MIRFRVTGATHDDIAEAADQIIRDFYGRFHTYTIDAWPMVRTGEGDILMWEADIECEGP